MISAICVYNDKKILNDWLMKGLKNQTAKHELITVDNTGNQFKSAASALNYGANQARGDYLMFVHQDVDLSSDKWLEDVEALLDKIPNLGIAGVAGASDSKCVFTNIKHGIPPRYPISIQIDKPTEVQSLDECLVIIPKPVFDRLKFDAQICNDWHLYAVDYCLSVNQLGLAILTIPFYVYHRSAGDSLSNKYYLVLTNVLKKHGPYSKTVCTTCGVWSSRYPVFLQRLYYSLRFILAKIGGGYIWRKSGLRALWRRMKK